MAIADDDIERLRSTVSIVDVVGQFVTLRKVGRNWVGLCPFHAERSPSFNVREETGRYKCFGCDKSGDVFTFVQEHEHVDFVGAVEHLAAKAGMQLTYTSSRAVPRAGPPQAAGRGDGDGGRVVPPAIARGSGSPGGPRLPALAWAERRRRPDVQARLGARRLGRPGAPVGHRRRAAAGHWAGLPQPPQPDAGRPPGRACCSRSSPTPARRWRSAGASCPVPTTRRSTRTRRRRRSTPSRRRSTG